MRLHKPGRTRRKSEERHPQGKQFHRTRILQIVLNGTNENLWKQYGKTFNDTAQIGGIYRDICLRIQELGGEPIPNTEYIRNKLVGFHPGFVEYICSRFEKGKIVRFTLELP